MSRLSLVALVGFLYASPAEASLDVDDGLSIRYARGSCNYHEYVLEISCDLENQKGKQCHIAKTYFQGKEIVYPSNLPFPDVAFRPPTILYCIDPPEKKKEEKKSFLCC